MSRMFFRRGKKQAKTLKTVIESVSFQWQDRENLGLSVTIVLTTINHRTKDLNTVLNRAKIACCEAK